MLCWRFLLASLCLVTASDAVFCNYRTGLLDNYLKNDAELYCFDGGAVTITGSSKKCSDANALTTPRSDDLSVLCPATHKLVGYSKYPCDSATGTLGKAIRDATNLVPHSTCVLNANDNTLCTAANVAKTTSPYLSLDPAFNVVNVKLDANASAPGIVYYPLVCSDGFDFKAGITGPVVGRCTDRTTNEFTLHSGSTSDGCYAKCPPNPSTLKGTTPPNLSSIAISTAQKSGAATSASINCANGFGIAADAPSTYSFTCTGEKGDAKNAGKYECTGGISKCPKCTAKCPAVGSSEAASSSVRNHADVANIKAIVSAGMTQNEQSSLTVECLTGFSTPHGAAAKYTVKCTSNDTDGAFKGMYELVAPLPECKPMCAKGSYVTIANTKSVVISADAKYGQSISGVVVCDTNYAHADGVSDNHDFVCGDDKPTAKGGQFKCKDGVCPGCFPECVVASADPTFVYTLAKDGKTPGPKIPKGDGLIEVACRNSSLKLLGPRFLNCDNGTLQAPPGQKAPVCEAIDWVCEAPKVTNAKTLNKNNIRVGEMHTVSCALGHVFDVETATKYAKGNQTSFYKADIICEKDKKIPDIQCFRGCPPPDFKGSVFPDMKTKGEAPYNEAQAVKYSCLDDKNIQEGKAEAVCNPVINWEETLCGACSFTASLFLTCAVVGWRFVF